MTEFGMPSKASDPWALLDEAKAEIKRLRADNEQLRAALKPFAERVDALSLSSALGHITREHLLEARRLRRVRDRV